MAVATVAICLPSFFYVARPAPAVVPLRQSAWLAAFLDSVNVCALALMAGVTFRLAADSLQGWQAWAIAVMALTVLLRWKVSPAWVALGAVSWGYGWLLAVDGGTLRVQSWFPFVMEKS